MNHCGWTQNDRGGESAGQECAIASGTSFFPWPPGRASGHVARETSTATPISMVTAVGPVRSEAEETWGDAVGATL